MYAAVIIIHTYELGELCKFLESCLNNDKWYRANNDLILLFHDFANGYLLGGINVGFWSWKNTHDMFS